MIRVVKANNLINFVEKFFLSSTFTSACFHFCASSEKNSKWSTESQRECEGSIDLSLSLSLFGFQIIIIIKYTRFISKLFSVSSSHVPIKMRHSLFFFYRKCCKAARRHSCKYYTKQNSILWFDFQRTLKS